MSEVLVFGRRYPRFVESVNGVITDVITPGFVQISEPPYNRTRANVVCQNKFPFPYSLVLLDDKQPQIVAVRYTPKSRVVITPYSELILD